MNKTGKSGIQTRKHHSIAQSTITELTGVWESVDKLKAGLARTERKLAKVGKECWDGLAEIPALQENYQHTELIGKQDCARETSGKSKSPTKTKKPVRKICNLADYQGSQQHHPQSKGSHNSIWPESNPTDGESSRPAINSAKNKSTTALAKHWKQNLKQHLPKKSPSFSASTKNKAKVTKDLDPSCFQTRASTLLMWGISADDDPRITQDDHDMVGVEDGMTYNSSNINGTNKKNVTQQRLTTVRCLNDKIPPSTLPSTKFKCVSNVTNEGNKLKRQKKSISDVRRLNAGYDPSERNLGHAVDAPERVTTSAKKGSHTNTVEAEEMTDKEDDSKSDNSMTAGISHSQHSVSTPNTTTTPKSTVSLGGSRNRKGTQHTRTKLAHTASSWPDVKRTDSLQKLGELVEKQQAKLRKKNQAGKSTKSPSSSIKDPIIPLPLPSETAIRPASYPELSTSQHQSGPPPIRKIASATLVSSYPGFSVRSAETFVSSKGEKREEIIGTTTSDQPSLPAKGKQVRDAKLPTERRIRKSHAKPKTKKVVKITGNIEDYAICPTSWRKGQELILRELGPFRLQRKKPDEDDDDVNDSIEETRPVHDDSEPESREIAVQTSFHNIGGNRNDPLYDSGSDNSDGIVAKSSMAESNSNSVTNKEAMEKLKSMLSQTDDETSGNVKTQINEKLRSKTVKKRKPNQGSDAWFSSVFVPESEKYQPAPKVRHYNADVVRSYMQKQRKERTKQLIMEKHRKQQEKEERQQKLQELRILQKKLAKIQMHGDLRGAESEHTDNGESKTKFLPQQIPERDFPPHRVTETNDVIGRGENDYGLMMDEEKENQPAKRLLVSNPRPNSLSSGCDSMASASAIGEQSQSPPSRELMRPNEKPSLSLPLDLSDNSPTLLTSLKTPLDDDLLVPFPNKEIFDKDEPQKLRSLIATYQEKINLLLEDIRPVLSSSVAQQNQNHAGTNDNEEVLSSRTIKLERIRTIAQSLQQQIAEETFRITQLRSYGENLQQPSFVNVGNNVGDLTSESVFLQPLILNGPEFGNTSPMPSEGQGEASSVRSDAAALSVEEPFETRHERIVRSKSQFSVFEGNLPGVSNLVKHAEAVASQQVQEAAARKIQAAYRGFQDQRSLAWRLQTERRIEDRVDQLNVMEIPHRELNNRGADSSTMSEGTLPSDGNDSVDLPDKREVGKNMFTTEFCAGTHSQRAGSDDSNQRSFLNDKTFPSNYFKSSTQPEKSDPYNFINTLHRTLQQDYLKLKSVPRDAAENQVAQSLIPSKSLYDDDDFEPSSDARDRFSSQRSQPMGAEAVDNTATGWQVTPISTQQSKMTVSTVSSVSTSKLNNKSLAGFKTSTPTDSANSNPTGSGPQASGSVSLHSEITPSRMTNNTTEEDDADNALAEEEETLSEGTLSFDSDASPKFASASAEISANSFHSNEEFEGQPGTSGGIKAKLTRDPEATNFFSRPASLANDDRFGLKFSPNSLRLRMTTELTYLESLEEGLQHATEVERLQNVGIARQESAMLAQALQNERQNRDQQVADLQIAVQQGSTNFQNNLADVQKRHEQTLAAAMESVALVRSEANMAINSAAHKLLQSQAEAAKVTAEAAKQLAQANTAAIKFGMKVQNEPSKMATETATSAAIAAVTSVLKQLHRRPSRKQQLHNESVSGRDDSETTQNESSSEVSYSQDSKSSSISKTELSAHDTLPSIAMTRQKIRASSQQGTLSIPEEIPPNVGATFSASTSKQIRNGNERKRAGKKLGAVEGSVSTHIGSSASERSPSPSTVSYNDEATLSEGSLAEEVIKEEIPTYSTKFEDSEEAEETGRNSSVPNLFSSDNRKRMEKKMKDYSILSVRTPSRSDINDANDGSPHVQSSASSAKDSYNNFTMEMVFQHMKKEELRAKHQLALLKLREKSLIDRTKAEVAWLELQRQQLKDKGEDDKMPPLRKRQRWLMLRLQQELGEIKRLREAQVMASQERQMIWEQQQQITKLRQSTKQILGKIREISPGLQKLPSLKSLPSSSRSLDVSPKQSFSRIHFMSHAVQTDDEGNVVVADTQSDIGEAMSDVQTPPSRDSKSDSELPFEPGSFGNGDQFTAIKPAKTGTASLAAHVLKGLRKLELNKRKLTAREQKLLQRRKDVESLLAWREKLDIEERKIRVMEEKALQKVGEGSNGSVPMTDSKGRGSENSLLHLHGIHQKQLEMISSVGTKNPKTTNSIRSEIESEIDTVMNTVRDVLESNTGSNIPSEVISTNKGSSVSTSISEESHPDIQRISASVAEEISSMRGQGKDDKTNQSPDSAHEIHTQQIIDYGSSFESSTSHQLKLLPDSAVLGDKQATGSGVTILSQQQNSPPSNPVELRLPLSPRTARNQKRRDSSGSEDSLTVSQSETASDLSDIEGRVHALKEELRRRKVEAERLRKEQKRRNKERLKAQEASLLKQIEAYDHFIWQAKSELDHELEVESQPKMTVKPQIRQPKVAESRHISKLQGSSSSPVSWPDGTGEDQHSHSIVSNQLSPRTITKDDTIASSLSELTTNIVYESSLKSPTLGTKSAGATFGKVETEIKSIHGHQPPFSDPGMTQAVESDNEESTSDSVKTVTEIGELRSSERLGEGGYGFEDDGIADIQNAVVDVREEQSIQLVDKATLEDEMDGKFDANYEKEPQFHENEPKNEQMATLEAIKSTERAESPLSVLDDIATSDDQKQTQSDDDTIAEEMEEEEIAEAYLDESPHSVKNSPHSVDDLDKVEIELVKNEDVIEVVVDAVAEALTEAMTEADDRLDEKDFVDDLAAGSDKSVSTSSTYQNENLHRSIVDEKVQSKSVILPCNVEKIVSTLIERELISAMNFIIQKHEEYQRPRSPTENAVAHQFHIPVLQPVEPLSLQDLISPQSKKIGIDAPASIPTLALADGITSGYMRDLVSGALDVMIGIYMQQQITTKTLKIVVGKNDAVASPSVGNRVKAILDELGQKTPSPQSRANLSDLLSLSSPTAYNDVLASSPEASPIMSPGKCVSTFEITVDHDLSTSENDRLATVTAKVDTENAFAHDSAFATDQDWFEDDLGLNDQPQPQPQDQQKTDSLGGNYYQIYPCNEYYYVREIPNKPPPPYTPPGQATPGGSVSNNSLAVATNSASNSAISSKDGQSSSSSSDSVTKVCTFHTEAEVQMLVARAVIICQSALTSLSPAMAPPPPDEYFVIRATDEIDNSDGDSAVSCQHSYRRFIYDLTAEILSDAHKAAHEPPRPAWMKPKWLSQRRSAVLPRKSTDLVAAVQHQVCCMISKPSPSSTSIQLSISGTSASGMSSSGRRPLVTSIGRKKHDRVDEILVQELREEELDWVLYDEDEVTVKVQMADSILNCLLKETALVASEVMQRLDNRSHPPGR